MARKNKTIAGYHILMLLSAVDRHHDVREDLVIREFLIEEFPPPIPINLDPEMEVLSALDSEKYAEHFDKMLDDFYEESTHDERLRLLDFAVGLVKADQVVHEQESNFIRKMITRWGITKSK